MKSAGSFSGNVVGLIVAKSAKSSQFHEDTIIFSSFTSPWQTCFSKMDLTSQQWKHENVTQCILISIQYIQNVFIFHQNLKGNGEGEMPKCN